jgi:hypothetical protein
MKKVIEIWFMLLGSILILSLIYVLIGDALYKNKVRNLEYIRELKYTKSDLELELTIRSTDSLIKEKNKYLIETNNTINLNK